MLNRYIEIAKGIVDNYYDLTDECENVSEAYVIGFRELGYTTEFIIGDFKQHINGGRHCWIEIEGIPIDLTVSQFGDFKNGIIKDEIYQKHYKIKERYNGEEFEPAEDEDEALDLDWVSSFHYLKEFREKVKEMS